MTQDIVARLREIIWSVTGCSDKLAIDAAEQAADLIDRLSCPAGDVVERVARATNDPGSIVGYRLPDETLSHWQARAALAASQSRPATGLVEAPWIVWSNEHRAFWAPNRRGYTPRIEKAGRYTKVEAEAICNGANYRANSTIYKDTPPEICMPAPEAFTALPPEPHQMREALETTRALVCKCAENGFTDHDALMELYTNNGAITAALSSCPTAPADIGPLVERLNRQAEHIEEITRHGNYGYAGPPYAKLYREAANALAALASSSGRDEGLPSEPTEAMLDAYDELCVFPDEAAQQEHRQAMRECWSTMLRVARQSTPPADPGQTEFRGDVGHGGGGIA